MERSYYRDGTPLDILRRSAKTIKREQNIKFSEALDRVAAILGEPDWSTLTKHCWAEPFSEPNAEDEGYVLQQQFGDDVIEVDFTQLAVAVIVEAAELSRLSPKRWVRLRGRFGQNDTIRPLQRLILDRRTIIGRV